MNTLVNPAVLLHRPGSCRSGRLLDVITRLQRTFQRWAERQRSRRELARLDDANLRDIGICRAAAEFEAGKAFWQD